MKRLAKKSLTVILTLTLLLCSFSCLASAELNQEAVNAHYGQYENYVLLGDSVASGYRDIITENDRQFNVDTKESAFNRIEGSYADIIADAIIADGSMTALAGPGFRTIEIRYMLEDDYFETCDDEYLFYCSNIKANGDPVKVWRPVYQEAVRNADLITLGVGGNDWGAYITWVVTEHLSRAGIFDELVEKVGQLISGSQINLDTVKEVLDIVATNKDAFASLLAELPSALEYGLTTFYENWDIMIEDIYEYNPDVTLVVVGMSDNSIKGKYYDYNGVEGGPVTNSVVGSSNAAAQTVIDFIMQVGNKPMIEGAKKFGYTYVDTTGTSYVESHPDAAGHLFMANKIIEALPDREISTKYDDMKPGHKYFSSIEYVLRNGIMTETSATTFSPDAALTNGQLAAAFNAINGTNDATNDTSEVTSIKLAFSFIGQGAKHGFTAFFDSISLAFKVLSANGINITKTITRGEAAFYLKTFCDTIVK